MLPVLILCAGAALTSGGVGGIAAAFLKCRSREANRARAERLAEVILDNPEEVEDARSLLVTAQGRAGPGNTAPLLLPSSKKARHLYIKGVVAEVKLVMGTPVKSEANRQVARRLARNIMEAHKMRPTHIASVLPMVVAAVFVSSKHELEAEQWAEDVGERQLGRGWLERLFGVESGRHDVC